MEDDRQFGGSSAVQERPTSQASLCIRQPAESEAERGHQLLAELQQTEQQLKILQNSTKAYVGTFAQPGPTRLFYREIRSPRATPSRRGP